MLSDQFLSNQWRHRSNLRSAALLAPARPGVYVIGKIRLMLGLPLGYEWAYVGRSDNLQRRLNEHFPQREEIPSLREWMLSKRGQIDIWIMPSTKNESRDLERQLIRSLEPVHNSIRFNSGKGETHE